MSSFAPRHHPDGSDLLATAHDLLSARLLPLLAEDQRHIGLMVAKAIAIAAREWPARACDDATAARAAAVAAALRSGSLDEGPEAQITWRDLHRQALAALRIDDPPGSPSGTMSFVDPAEAAVFGRELLRGKVALSGADPSIRPSLELERPAAAACIGRPRLHDGSMLVADGGHIVNPL